MTKSTKIKISNDLKSFNELTEKAVSHMETFIASEGGRLSASTGELYDVIQKLPRLLLRIPHQAWDC